VPLIGMRVSPDDRPPAAVQRGSVHRTGHGTVIPSTRSKCDLDAASRCIMEQRAIGVLDASRVRPNVNPR
jgi:hypothetical protein